MNRRRWIGVGLLLAATAVFSVGMVVTSQADADATDEALRLKRCPWSDLQCLDVWDPVTCNGVTYSNACYARRACATNCVPGNPAW